MTINDPMPLHPDFEQRWETDKRLVFWWSYRLSNRLGWEDTLGSVFMHFNNCIYDYNPERSKFSTWFSRYLINQIRAHFMRYESEVWNRYFKDIESDFRAETITEDVVSRRNYQHYTDPDEVYVNKIIEFFENTDDFWKFITHDLDERSAFILKEYYNGQTLEQVGNKLDLTKERIRQLRNLAVKAISGRAAMLEKIVDVFVPEY